MERYRRRSGLLQYSICLPHCVASVLLACGIDDRVGTLRLAPDAGHTASRAGSGQTPTSTRVDSGASSTDGGSTPVTVTPAKEPTQQDAGDAVAPPARGSVAWVSHFPDSFVDGIAFDRTDPDQLVCAGSFGSSLTLGEREFVSAGGSDGYLARFMSVDGSVVDARSFGATADEGPLGIVGAPDGSFAVQGYYTEGLLNLGGVNEVEAATGGLFVAVYDSSLRARWSKTFDGASFGLTGNALDVNGSGAPLISGSFQDTIDLGETVLTGVGQRDAFFARFRGTDGTVQQVAHFGTAAAENGSSALFLLGNYVIAGTFSSALEVGAGPPMMPVGGQDIFLAAFSSSGTYQWRLGIGGPLDEGSMYMAADRAGNIYVCGTFQQTLQLGPATLQTRGGSDIFLARLSPTGVVQWAQGFGGGGNDRPRGISVSPLGVVGLTGEFAGEIDFGGGIRASAGDLDGFVASFDPDGTHRWDRTYGDVLIDRGLGVLVAEDGSVYANLEFMGSVDFGQGPIHAGDTYDSVILRYFP